MSRYVSIIRAILLDACAEGLLQYPPPLNDLEGVEARMRKQLAAVGRESLEDLSVGEFRLAALWAAGGDRSAEPTVAASPEPHRRGTDAVGAAFELLPECDRRESGISERRTEPVLLDRRFPEGSRGEPDAGPKPGTGPLSPP